MSKAKSTPWDHARKLQVSIRDSMNRVEHTHCILERGVNYFVLQMRKMGIRTQFSCEGHPGGFYIMFRASLKKARELHDCGYFTYEITRPAGHFVMRMRDIASEPERVRVLRWASAAWEKQFGPHGFIETPEQIIKL